MADVSPNLSRAVVSAMREASVRAILPRWRRLAEGEIVAKAPGDVVTVADHDSEAILTERLAALLPGSVVVGEEAVHADASLNGRLGDALCWIVDPLDGTRNFAAGRPPFGVIVALAERGETIAGWLYDPLQDRLCHAARGGGAFVGGERIAARATGERPPVAAISLVFADPEQRAGLIAAIADGYRVVDIPYCAAEQYPRLALGENDIAFFGRTLAWDHAAGALWLNEAGGRAARLDGSPYRADQWRRYGMIAAASPSLWEDFAARLDAAANR